jgi:hypothetical protein
MVVRGREGRREAKGKKEHMTRKRESMPRKYQRSDAIFHRIPSVTQYMIGCFCCPSISSVIVIVGIKEYPTPTYHPPPLFYSPTLFHSLRYLVLFFFLGVIRSGTWHVTFHHSRRSGKLAPNLLLLLRRLVLRVASLHRSPCLCLGAIDRRALAILAISPLPTSQPWHAFP